MLVRDWHGRMIGVVGFALERVADLRLNAPSHCEVCKDHESQGV